MKKSFFIVLICVALLLTCCNSSNQDTSDIADTHPSAQETEPASLQEYPGLIGAFVDTSSLCMIPEEIFTSSAEETGLGGTLYRILGTTEEYIYDENGNIDSFRVSTYYGDIIVGDPYSGIIYEGELDELGTFDADKLREFLPIPPEGRIVHIYAEYGGTSAKYECPYFIYGGTDYLVEAAWASMIAWNEPAPEEIQEDTPTVTEPEPTEETQTITQYGAGMYKVGVDLPAGEYLFFANDRYSAYVCASTDSNQDDILENENFDYTFFITVEDGQYLQANRCVFVEASSTTVEINADGSLPEGMYRVGIDIPAGEYKLTADDSIPGYWCTYNSTAIPFDIEDNDNFEGSTYVTVTDGQYLIINRCTAEPVE